MEKQQDKKRMSHREAWADFYAKYRAIRPVRDRKKLGAEAVKAIPVAQADFLGKRKGRNGKPLALGEQRVAWILQAATAAMPELFQYRQKIEEGWFEGE